MIDISQFPYFSHNDCIDKLMEPINNQADVRMVQFTRRYSNQERFLICYNKEYCIDFYEKLQNYGLYEKNIQEYVSCYNMWDHLPYAPPQVYEFARTNHNIAHGLTIVQQHGNYCDFFSFSSHKNNSQINNFYLNKKDLFANFVQEFYKNFSSTLKDTSYQKISIPDGTDHRSFLALSPRQSECIQLLAMGLSSKEIARALQLSPRTVEEYINILKKKFNAKNRPQLLYFLNKHL